jgi:hypothetical protein
LLEQLHFFSLFSQIARSRGKKMIQLVILALSIVLFLSGRELVGIGLLVNNAPTKITEQIAVAALFGGFGMTIVAGAGVLWIVS